MASILIVDDVKALAEQYAYDLSRLGNHDTRVAGSGKEALDILEWSEFDCMILDLEMPEMDGFEVLRKMDQKSIRVPVIVYTGTGDFDRCTQAIRLGASSFIDKAESMERVAQEVSNVLGRERLQREVVTLRRESGGESPLIGNSPALRKLNDQIDRVAAIPSPVLIVGESGTGKELVARELHRRGPGNDMPFVAINSAALPENLVESELFGHERGAFTGANKAHRGAFEVASGGTLFLDEIGDLPTSVQAKLLRVLEQGEVTRIGAEASIKIDARVVAATHRDLDAAVEAGTFRQDLYYRLNVHIVSVPSLRERPSDIPLLLDHFVEISCSRFGISRKRIAADAREVLVSHSWQRNNVRELRNIVERMIIATDAELIGVDAIPADVRGTDTSASGQSLRDRKLDAERRIILAALERNEWHITKTAEDLELADHASLLKIMRRHHLKQS